MSCYKARRHLDAGCAQFHESAYIGSVVYASGRNYGNRPFITILPRFHLVNHFRNQFFQRIITVIELFLPET